MVSLSGCARTPSGVETSTIGDLLVTLTVAGTLNPAYDYFVVFNTSNNSSPGLLTGGPCPVIAAGGNGFVSGAATQFFEYNGSNQNGEVYSFITSNTASPLGQYEPIGPPTSVNVSSNSIQFRVPLSYLATSTISATNISYMQINFLTYSNLDLTNGNQVTYFDALGGSSSAQLSGYISISVAQGATYSSTNGLVGLGLVQQTTGNGQTINAVDQGSAESQSLYITGWSVQVEN